MARTNLSLGNLYRAVSGSARAGAVSIGGLGGNTANSSLLGFATDSITVTVPTFTYIVESTTENAQFSFNSTGSLFYSKVQQVANNYTCSFGNANFTTGTRTFTNGPTIIPITPAAVAAANYSEASSVLTMKYEDGYNINATNYASASVKTLYAVDVYNTINEPDFCLLFGTKVTLANGTEINIEDLNVGDEIKSWVPAGLPDETQPLDSENDEWRFYYSNELSGTAQNVTVRDITFNFAAGYFSLNNGLINATETHPLYVWDNEIGKYKFKNVGEILPGDKLIMQDESHIEITNIELITADVEIATLNVENADVFLSNGLISHNKGTTTQPYIPSSGLRMYLDPSKSSSTSGTTTADWLDLSGYNTGMRPAGVTNAAGITGTNPGYNNGASRKEKYWTIGADNTFWYKDRTTNINGGITQFDTTGMTYITWFRFSALPTNGTGFGLFSKDGADVDYRLNLTRDADIAQFNFTSNRGSTQNSTVLFGTTNVWYQVAVTVAASGNSIIYIDGVAGPSQSAGTFNATSSYNIFLGNKGQSGAYQQGPALFYNRALTSTEITQVYNYFSPTYK
jgi:hypothetical protein